LRPGNKSKKPATGTGFFYISFKGNSGVFELFTQVTGIATKNSLDAQQLVVFSYTIRTGYRSGFKKAGIRCSHIRPK